MTRGSLEAPSYSRFRTRGKVQVRNSSSGAYSKPSLLWTFKKVGLTLLSQDAQFEKLKTPTWRRLFGGASLFGLSEWHSTQKASGRGRSSSVQIRFNCINAHQPRLRSVVLWGQAIPTLCPVRQSGYPVSTAKSGTNLRQILRETLLCMIVS